MMILYGIYIAPFDQKRIQSAREGKKKDKGDERGDRKNDQLLREEESFKNFLERNQVGDASVHSSMEVVPETWRIIREGSVISESAGLGSMKTYINEGSGEVSG